MTLTGSTGKVPGATAAPTAVKGDIASEGPGAGPFMPPRVANWLERFWIGAGAAEQPSPTFSSVVDT